MSSDTSRALIICAIFAAYVLSGGLSVPSLDFNAIWMAGRSVASGQFDQIYPQTNGLFALQSPESWNAQLLEEGADGAIYPFIYPPLWAWIAQVLPKTTNLQTAVSVFLVVNTLALVGIAWLAWRIGDRTIPLWLHLAIVLAIFAFTSAGRQAIGNNQPQILLSLLVLIAIERTIARRAFVGGALMALAASIKGLPLLYAVLWLFQGQWRAVIAFAFVGSLLAAISVVTMGWPLHETFLSLLGDIRQTYLILWLNITFDGMIGNLFFSHTTIPSYLAVVGEYPLKVALAAPKPPAMAALSTGLALCAFAACAMVMRRNPDDPLVWPLVLILLSVSSPLAWNYHYLASFAFLPCLISRLGPKWGAICTATVTLPQLSVVAGFVQDQDGLLEPYRVVLLILMLIMAAAFALAIRRGPPQT